MPEETFGDACQKTGGKIMTKLDCSVTGCMHNAENCCCKCDSFYADGMFEFPETVTDAVFFFNRRKTA